MKIHFTIQFEDAAGNLCETLSCCTLSREDHKQMMRDLLEDYLNNFERNPHYSYFSVGGVCKCHD